MNRHLSGMFGNRDDATAGIGGCFISGSSERRILAVFITLALLIFFGTVLSIFLSKNLWDADFWWHIATGKYIATEKALPEKDPFSYTTALEENRNPFPERENFLLKQYWLADVLFYLIYDGTGAKGIIWLRSVLLALTIYIVYWRLRRAGTVFPVAFVFSYLVYFFALRVTGERPVLFTILFTAVVLVLNEEFRERRGKLILLLIPLMLLWSNMHGGFIIGVIIISMCLLGEILKMIFGRSHFRRGDRVIFFGAAVGAIMVSYINPTGWDAFVLALSPKYDALRKNVQEWQSPFFFYLNRIRPIEYRYILLGCMFPLVLIVRNKKLDLTHVILLAGFFYEAVMRERFVIFYAIAGTMILGREIDIIIKRLLQKHVSEGLQKRIEYGMTVAVLCLSLLFLIGHAQWRPAYGMAKQTEAMDAAVSFIERHQVSGNMFNEYGYGGYIAWRMFPQQKTFIDSRALNIVVRTEYDWIMGTAGYAGDASPSVTGTPVWERLLNHYRINIVFLSLMSQYGQIPPLLHRLIEDKQWVTVYCDPVSIVLVRNTDENRIVIEDFEIADETVYNIMAYESIIRTFKNKTNPRALMSLAEIFYKMGRFKDAVKAYEYALKRMPENRIIPKRMKQIESEMSVNEAGEL